MKVTKIGRLGKTDGFSLVEVAMAMAVVGFAMVSILGMLPMGLTNFRHAMDNTVEAQIVQGIASEVQLTSFSKLNNGTLTFNYDADGNATKSLTPFYTATVTGTSIDGTKQPVNLYNPSANVPSQLQVAGNVMKISIVNNNLSTTQRSLSAHVYSIIVANQNN